MWARQAPDSLGDFLQPEMITTKGHIAYTKQSQNTTSPFLTTQKKINGFSTTAAIVEQAPKNTEMYPELRNPLTLFLTPNNPGPFKFF